MHQKKEEGRGRDLTKQLVFALLEGLLQIPQLPCLGHLEILVLSVQPHSAVPLLLSVPCERPAWWAALANEERGVGGWAWGW